MFLYMCSVYHQFMVATVQTLIVSTTEPLDYILFPKIVVCNKYKLRSALKSALYFKIVVCSKYKLRSALKSVLYSKIVACNKYNLMSAIKSALFTSR
jgi:hypothetical protein